MPIKYLFSIRDRLHLIEEQISQSVVNQAAMVELEGLRLMSLTTLNEDRAGIGGSAKCLHLRGERQTARRTRPTGR